MGPNTRQKRSLAILAALAAVLAVTATVSAQAADGADAEAVRLSRTGTFEIHVQGADLRGVLQLLSTQGKRNIVATKEVTGTVTADLYSVTFEEALDAVMRSSGFVYQAKGNFIYVYTPEQLAAIKQAERKFEVRIFQLYYITAEDAQTLITPALSSDGSIALSPASETGITASNSDAGGNSLAGTDVIVVHDYEENVKHIAAMLEELDIRPQQVLIEATILRASLTENNALGIDFNVLAGIDFEGLNSTTAGVTDIVPEASTTYMGQRLATFQQHVSSSIPEGGLTIGVITNNVAMFIRALESVTDTTVLANPKLLVLNKQRAEVMIGSRDGYLTTTVTETMSTQSVEFLDTGTRLLVRPYIGKNGYIRMEIHAEDSDGSVKLVGNMALPAKTTTETTQNVMVRDGHTIVIAGLFREDTDNNRSQTPILGNIPYLGALFRSTSDGTDRVEVIILVTPHIISHDPDETVGERAKDDIERFRIGQRKGLRWWGRSRLAQTHMRWARQELRDGNRAKALWNVDMALSLSPRMIAAIEFKERLTESALWSDESRASSVKYLIQQLVMQELGLPVERIIPLRKPRDPNKVAPAVRKAFGIGDRYEDPLTGPMPPAAATEQSGVPIEQLIDEDEVAEVKVDKGEQAKATEAEAAPAESTEPEAAPAEGEQAKGDGATTESDET